MSEKGKGAAVTLNKQDLRRSWFKWMASSEQSNSCLLYTSDAADE